MTSIHPASRDILLRRNNFLVIGRAGMDLYADPPGMEIENATSFTSTLGGSAANIAVAVSRQGGWSGFPPHKHDTDRLPLETRHDETYDFRFRPNHGFGLQLVQKEDGKTGEAYHLTDGSTVVLETGYHLCVAAPGYEMYYFTILGDLSQRSLVQFFQPTHAYKVETIPGIKDMIAKFK